MSARSMSESDATKKPSGSDGGCRTKVEQVLLLRSSGLRPSGEGGRTSAKLQGGGDLFISARAGEENRRGAKRRRTSPATSFPYSLEFHPSGATRPPPSPKHLCTLSLRHVGGESRPGQEGRRDSNLQDLVMTQLHPA